MFELVTWLRHFTIISSISSPISYAWMKSILGVPTVFDIDMHPVLSCRKMLGFRRLFNLKLQYWPTHCEDTLLMLISFAWMKRNLAMPSGNSIENDRLVTMCIALVSQ